MRPGDFLCARFPLDFRKLAASDGPGCDGWPTGFFGLLFGHHDRPTQSRARTPTGRSYAGQPHVLIEQRRKDKAAPADSCTAQILSHSITSPARLSGVGRTSMPS
jgi:hypothetical protein